MPSDRIRDINYNPKTSRYPPLGTLVRIKTWRGEEEMTVDRYYEIIPGWFRDPDGRDIRVILKGKPTTHNSLGLSEWSGEKFLKTAVILKEKATDDVLHNQELFRIKELSRTNDKM